MDLYTQAGRPIKVHTPLGPDVLLLVGVRGREAVSELYQFELELLAANYMVIEFDKLMGQGVAVEMQLPTGESRYFHGIVSRFSEGKSDNDFTRYRARIVPQLWLFTKRVQSRIFQHLSVPDILKQVLADLGENVEFKLTGTYQPRDYTVQYQESDFAFASRLMEEEGISYYFEHQADKHILHLVDEAASFPETSLPKTATYDPIPGGTGDTFRVTEWEKTQQLVSGSFTTWDYCFQLPSKNLEAQAKVPPSVKVGQVAHAPNAGGVEPYEVYEYPGWYAKRYDNVGAGGEDDSAVLEQVFDDEQRTVELRMQAEAALALEAEGQGNCGHFVPGHTFALLGHRSADGKYLLKSVEHEASLPDFRSGEQLPLKYLNRFTCLPAEATPRPQRTTPRPIVYGTQTATVVGPSGSQIFTDKYGRIKVQFHWDRQGKHNADSSCWIRVAQVWAGNRWGRCFWPRIGHEVVVAFEDGDPDQPIVVGSVYNETNMPPFTMPDDQDVAGIKSCSLGGDPLQSFNALLFHDDPQNEHIHLHSQNHELVTSESSKHRYTPGPRVSFSGTPLIPLPGSGSGGGLLDFLDLAGAISGEDKPDWLEEYEKLFPGDYICHTLGGAVVNLICDPEGMLLDKLLGFAGSLLGGAAGNNTLTYGSNAALTYVGPDLSVRRGEGNEFHTESLTLDSSISGKAVLVLSILICSTAAAADIAGRVYQCKKQAALKSKNKEAAETATEALEWATLITRAVTQRFIAVLIHVETANAQANTAEANVAKAAREAQEAAELTARINDIALEVATRQVETSAENIKRSISAVEQAAVALTGRVSEAESTLAQNSKQVTGNYGISAYNLDFTAAIPWNRAAGRTQPDTRIRIAAQGKDFWGSPASQGHLDLAGDVISAKGGTCDIHASKTTNVFGGSTVFLQGGSTLSGTRFTMTGLPPSISMSTGVVDTGPSITLNSEGLTLKYVEWSITLNAEGITLSVGPTSIALNPEGVTINGMNITLTADLKALLTALQLQDSVEAQARSEDVLRMYS